MTPRRVQPHHVFFPAALVLAAMVVPLKAGEWAGRVPWQLPLHWHGHEMVFGVAFAVIGGYLLTGRGRAIILAAFAAWLAGRTVNLAPVFAPGVQAGVSILYPLMLSFLAGQPFLRAAKSGRNLAFLPVIAGFTIAEIIVQLGRLDLLAGGSERGIILGSNLVLLLLFIMGGRIIGAATSGAHQSMGRKLVRAAQPRLEHAGVICLGGALLLDLVGGLALLAGGLAILAGLIGLARIHAWQAWRLIKQPAVSVLHLGYLWLALGLIAKGAGQATGEFAVTQTLHIALIGGFGTLAIAMIIRATLQRARLTVRLPPIGAVAIGLVTVATIARGLAIIPAIIPVTPISLLWASAAAWTLAVVLALAWVVRVLAGQTQSAASSRRGPNRTGA